MISQKDGFGFAYSTEHKNKHSYYVEKYTNPSNFTGLGTVGYSKNQFEKLGDAIELPMLSSGKASDPTGPIIMHSRTATNSVNLKNTHPFRKKGWALVHNGVVDLDTDYTGLDNKVIVKLDKRYSSCDSEWLLNTYVHGTGHHMWSECMTGYAATMAISPKNEMIIAKDDCAQLHIAAIPSLNNALVFSTKAGYASELAKAIGHVATSSFPMTGERAIRIQPNGEVTISKFESMASGYTSTATVNKSLGYTPATRKQRYTTHNSPASSYQSKQYKANKATEKHLSNQSCYTKVYNPETNQMELL
jgi:predicted glutamine amidotransferase